MSKSITYVPLSSVERIELRVTNCRKTLSQVKEETGAHYVLNGGMWNPDGSACPLLKVGGVMRSGTPWRAMGYAWDKGPDIHMTSEYGGADNFIAVTALIASGKPVDKPSYGSAQGGKRGRSAIGLRGGSLALYCSGDGTRDAATTETLRDGKAGPGNTTSIGIEICVNAGGDFEAAKANAAALVRLLMEEHGIPLDNVVQHNRWNGKDCPKTIRATAGAWEAFLALCQGGAADVSDLDTDVDTLAEAGIINSPDYWRAGDYSAANVQALIGKMADYVREDE